MFGFFQSKRYSIGWLYVLFFLNLIIACFSFMLTNIQQSDEVLVKRLHSDDASAFAELYNRHWEKMILHVVRVLGSKEDAFDIVQEVFVSIWKRRHELDITGPPEAYLLRSVRNIAIRYIEKDITRNNYLQSLSAAYPFEMDPSSTYEFKELQLQVDKAVAELPSKMQEVYILSRRDKLSYKEIASHMRIAENTVKKQLSNALKSLRAAFSKISLYTFTKLF